MHPITSYMNISNRIEFFYLLFDDKEIKVFMNKLDKVPEKFKDTVKESKEKWNDELNGQVITSEKTDVKMSFFDTQIVKNTVKRSLKKVYLKAEWIEKLFKEDGSINEGNRETAGYYFINTEILKINKFMSLINLGKNIVKALKTNEGVFVAYVKFYPEYPLRQYAIDELCYKLSGLGAYTTLAKLIHIKSNKFYPVLFSRPYSITLGGVDIHTLEEIPSNLKVNLDSYYFTWKVFETYLIEPRDEKEDNLAIKEIKVEPRDEKEDNLAIKVDDTKYALVSIDSDYVFGFNSQEIKDKPNHPNSYSIVYLLESMREPLNYIAMKKFLNLNYVELLKTWLNELILTFKDKLVGKNDTLNLFSSFEVNLIIENRTKLFKKHSLSRVDKLFSFRELTDLFVRMRRLHETLETFNKEIFERFFKNYNFNGDAKLSIELDKLPKHFELLNKIDEHDYKIYHEAYKKGDNASNRFKLLPCIQDHFEYKKSNSLHSLNPISGSWISKFEDADLFPIVGYNKLELQIKILDNYIQFKNTGAYIPNALKLHFESKLEDVNLQNIQSLRVLCLKKCDDLGNTNLIDLIKNCTNLSYLYISECNGVKDRLIFDFKKKMDVMILANLKELKFIDFGDVTIEHLHLIKLVEVEELWFKESSHSLKLNLEDLNELKYIFGLFSYDNIKNLKEEIYCNFKYFYWEPGFNKCHSDLDLAIIDRIILYFSLVSKIEDNELKSIKNAFNEMFKYIYKCPYNFTKCPLSGLHGIDKKYMKMLVYLLYEIRSKQTVAEIKSDLLKIIEDYKKKKLSSN